MQLKMPDELTIGHAILTLDDGRRVSIDGDGVVRVSRSATQLGGEDYTLVLPSTEHVATECDARDDAYSNGHTTITVEHRH